MEEKALLISSMEKLINHIVISRKNQEEIFASLSRNDFKKIISNLDDEGQNLRKISLVLIARLLHNHPTLKQKFCNTMNIPLVAGRVSLSAKLCPGSRSKSNIAHDVGSNIHEVFALLKQPITQPEDSSYFWFIHYEHRKEGKLQLEFVSRLDVKNINFSELLDPVDCMIGFVLHDHNYCKVESPQQSRLAPNENRRRKSQYQPSNKHTINNFFKPTHMPQYKQGQQIHEYQSMNIGPGYSTERENIGKGAGKAANISYQSMHVFTKGTMNQSQPPKVSDMKNGGHSKYTKLSINASKNREPKFIEETSLPLSKLEGPLVSIGTKTMQGQRERGYQSGRQKKPIEKHPL